LLCLLHSPAAHLLLVYPTGLHLPRTLRGERQDDLVRTTWSEVDVVVVCLPANEKVGPGDRFLLGELAKLRRPAMVAAVTKTDLVGPGELLEHLAAVAALADETGVEWQQVVPVSALTGDQLELLCDLVLGSLPPGPKLYPDGHLSDEPEEKLVAELIREAALEEVHDELPHSIAVVVEEMVPRPGRAEDARLVDVRAHLFVERDSQKPIVIGVKGARLRTIGSRARKQIERILGSQVHLDLRVKVAKEWQRDPRQLRRLG